VRTLLITLGGFGLGAIFLGLAAFLAPGRGAALTGATVGFISVWCANATLSLWVGAARWRFM